MEKKPVALNIDLAPIPIYREDLPKKKYNTPENVGKDNCERARVLGTRGILGNKP